MIKRCSICGKYIHFSGNCGDYLYKMRALDITHYFCGNDCYRIGEEELKTKIHIDTKSLLRARKTYGDTNQIAVCIEELSELIKVLAKYFRYDPDTAMEKLREDALDETTDVYIILEHVKGIFNLRNGEINNRSRAKIDRLNRWLNTSSDFSYTMEDREV